MHKVRRTPFHFNLERVVRFLTVAEQLSFTRAAEILGMDQPWLSRQIIQMEEQLGFELFDRSRSPIALTSEGQELLESAHEIAQATQRFRQKADELKRRNQAALRIGVAYSTFPLPQRAKLLDHYAAIRPNVRLELSSSEFSDDVVEMLRANEVDFGIVVGPMTTPDIEVCVLADVQTHLAIPAEDPLASGTHVELPWLKGRRIGFVMLPDAPRYKFAYSWIEKVGAIPHRVVDGRRFIYDVAQRERLIVVCYPSDDTLPTDFVRLPIKGPRPHPNLCLVRHRRTLSSAADRFWRLAEEISQAH